MDRSGFEARVRALWPGMVRLARCVVSDQADAEDAAAQAVLNCYRRLSSLRREEAFDAWLMRACVNEARSIVENFVEAGYDVPRILTAGLQVADEKLNGADKEEEE